MNSLVHLKADGAEETLCMLSTKPGEPPAKLWFIEESTLHGLTSVDRLARALFCVPSNLCSACVAKHAERAKASTP